MGRAYSLDLRNRVVAAVGRGKSRRAAALFDVSVASVVKWTQRAYETGSPAAKTNMSPRPWMVPARREASRQGSSRPLGKLSHGK
jgi:transposase